MIRLSVPENNYTGAFVRKHEDKIDVKVLVLYPFFVEADANGNSFDIKESDVRAIHDVHNREVNSLWNKLVKMGKNIPIKDLEVIPNQKDHQQTVDNTVGHVVGEYELMEGEGGPFLFANLRVKGKENADKVQQRLWSKVSIGFDPKTHKSFEISWVVNGAIPNAQNISFSENISKNNEKIFNTSNVTNIKAILLSKYEKNLNLIKEKEIDLEIENMLINLKINSKILPKDDLRVRTELKRIPDRASRLAAFNILNENMINVIDYSVRNRNNMALDFKESLPMKDGKIDMTSIAIKSAIALKKGEKAKFEEKEPKDDNEVGKKKIEKQEKKEDKEAMRFKKKDKKHIMKLAEDGDMEEMGKYLSAFCSEEEIEDEDEKAEKKEEKEKVKFSKEITELKDQIALLAKQNETFLSQVALLSKNSEEARACFNEVQNLLNTSK